MDNKELLKSISELMDQKLETALEPLKIGQQRLETGQQDVVSRLNKLETGQHRLEFLLEHELPTQIKQLAEGHMGLLDHLPDADAVEDLQHRVGALETITKQNTADIKELKAI